MFYYLKKNQNIYSDMVSDISNIRNVDSETMSETFDFLSPQSA